MRMTSKKEEIDKVLDNVKETYLKRKEIENRTSNEKSSREVFIISHRQLVCPYCEGEAILEYVPEDAVIQSVWCRKCGWIDDFDYIQDLLGERESKLWKLRPESMVLNPFMACPKCNKPGMVEFLSNFREVKIIGCLRCGWLTNKGIFEERQEVDREELQ